MQNFIFEELKMKCGLNADHFNNEMWTKCGPFQHFGSHADQVRNCGPLFFTPCHENIISMYIIFLAFQNLCKEFQQVPRYPSYQAVLNHHGYHNCAVQLCNVSKVLRSLLSGLSGLRGSLLAPHNLRAQTACPWVHCTVKHNSAGLKALIYVFTGLGDLFEVQFCKDTTPTGHDLPGLSELVQPIWQIYQLHCVECSVRSADTIIENM